MITDIIKLITNNNFNSVYTEPNSKFFNTVALKSFNKILELNNFNIIAEFKYLKDNIVDFDLINYEKEYIDGYITLKNGENFLYRKSNINGGIVLTVVPEFNKDKIMIFCEEPYMSNIIYRNSNGNLTHYERSKILSVSGINLQENTRNISVYNNSDIMAKFFIDINSENNDFYIKSISNYTSKSNTFTKQEGQFWFCSEKVEDAELHTKGNLIINELNKDYFKSVSKKLTSNNLQKINKETANLIISHNVCAKQM